MHAGMNHMSHQGKTLVHVVATHGDPHLHLPHD